MQQLKQQLQRRLPLQRRFPEQQRVQLQQLLLVDLRRLPLQQRQRLLQLNARLLSFGRCHHSVYLLPEIEVETFAYLKNFRKRLRERSMRDGSPLRGKQGPHVTQSSAVYTTAVRIHNTMSRVHDLFHLSTMASEVHVSTLVFHISFL